MTTHHRSVWADPAEIARTLAPTDPVLIFAPTVLQDAARRFLEGFPGLVTYAVKSNPSDVVIENLVAAGIRGFDVASPWEIDLIGRLAPGAARHYHNPVRAKGEIAHAVAAGITAWSVDSASELDKLFAAVPTEGVEISPRFKLPVAGAAYDFGSKFGAAPDLAADLLRAVAARGYIPSLTFHPGTQCTDPAAWESYIAVAADIARTAGVRPARLNVGGGFPSWRVPGAVPELEAIFARIASATRAAFGDDAPALVCEPGRALCGDAFSLMAQVKAVRDGTSVFLNDGVYGGLTELPLIGNLGRIDVLRPDGSRREDTPKPRPVFGPTCDSVDRLPGEIALPAGIEEGDYVVFHGAGAYSVVTNTRFNGFGNLQHLTAMSLG